VAIQALDHCLYIEHDALYAGMQKLVWLRGVMAELGLPFDEPTSFFLDSQSAEKSSVLQEVQAHRDQVSLGAGACGSGGRA
jgi:hypothetical protein